MKLQVIDHGDPSVGIPVQIYEIDCPFDESIDQENRAYFLDAIYQVYKEYCDGKINLSYSDEPYEDF